ncbi:MAG: UDP-N-acetylmuramoyl-L-alanyl-D-glutamate--2,6-diaminopimelate ligase [Alphaproteobacteria bacterium]|nr:UDP-N-acetylmuramoyl-L-alanyl-D-glutamate--2,6-diaminopimelate ligase [Alphaproteobacteria bacterium]MBV9694626.1 UDP-N-acetylmuramoyl-L-alanyl-D-glutamate--2,6-diaminopimelate ligase [Alphaproteobacteria bacterium]
MATQSRASLLALKVVDQNAMKASKEFSGIASDSRAVRPGYLFAALAGSRRDGASFLADAAARGAVAVLGRPELQAEAEALGVRFIAADNPRAALAKQAAAFFGAQPKTVAAVTGTNGKTSVAVFLRQIWQALGHAAASMGTVGLVTANGEVPLAQTTPDPIVLHEMLAELKRQGIEHLAIEASSHGLDQHRLDGVAVSAVAFTNITRDHLDYHSSFENYLAAKLRLFQEIVREGGVAVINVAAEHSGRFLDAARARGLEIVRVGYAGSDIALLEAVPHQEGQRLSVAHKGRGYAIDLPLVGNFQASNALVAAGLAIGLGAEPRRVFAALPSLKGAPGRLERVAKAASGGTVYVDYAHTPDALETVLTAIRPHTEGRLHVVFGCGGDRDAGKRPMMGAVAARLADRIIVTDDNPRSEDPAAIRRAILAGCPHAREIGSRRDAIRASIDGLDANDVLVIAGKGHESGQTIGNETRPFSDRAEAVAWSAA